MKKFLLALLGLGLVFATASPTFAQNSGKHGKRKGGGHKHGAGTRGTPSK